MKKKKFFKDYQIKKKHILLILLITSFVIGAAAIYSLYGKAAIDDSSCKTLATKNLRLRCYAVARIDIKESPAYSNRGSYIDAWNKKGGCPLGSPWCASFVTSLMERATGSSLANTCSTALVVDYFKKHHRSYTFSSSLKLNAGDVFYRTRPNGGVGAGHVGIFNGYGAIGGKSILYVIEANTKCASINNDCVRQRTYNLDGSPRNGDNLSSPKWELVLRYKD